MAPYKVREGLEVEFDFNKITISDWRHLFDSSRSAEEDDAVVSKITGLDAPTISQLTLPEYKRLFKAIVKASGEQTDPT